MAKQAAEAGFIAAQMSLAAHYFADETDYGGLDTKKSMEDAIHWWQKAAEQGSNVARFNIGLCYETGTVLPQSFENKDDLKEARLGSIQKEVQMLS